MPSCRHPDALLARPPLRARLDGALALMALLRGKHEGLNRGNPDPNRAG